MPIETLALPAVRVLLIAVIFLALLVEVKTAGMGLGAALGLVAAGVFFASQYVSGLVSYFEIAVFLGGILCIAIELLTPGIGIFAGLGVFALLYSFIFALGGGMPAVYTLLISLFMALAAFAVIVKRLPNSKLWAKFVLRDAGKTEDGYVSSGDYSYLLGHYGLTTTNLRPAGTANFNGQQFDVISEGNFIDKGERVRVISVSGSRIVVSNVM